MTSSCTVIKYPRIGLEHQTWNEQFTVHPFKTCQALVV